MIFLKAQLFGVLNIHSVITWLIIWLLPFMLNIPSVNLTELLALDWPFYNFKSPKSNGSTSLFRKKVLVILKALIKAFYLAQLLDPPLIALPLKIFFLAAKTSLLTLPSPWTITSPLYYIHSLPLLLRWLSLFCSLWPNTWKMTSSKSSGPF